MRKVAIYFLLLIAASAAAFLGVYSFGKKSSLEQELSRREVKKGAEQSLTIPSLKPVPEEEPDEEEEIVPPRAELVSQDVTVRRAPAENPGMVLLVDRSLMKNGYKREWEEFLKGLELFFSRRPAALTLGLRTLASQVPDECGDTLLLKAPGNWPAEQLRESLWKSGAEGPQSLGRGLEEAALDLEETPGDRAVVIVTAGDEGCGGSPCRMAAALAQGEKPVRVSVVLFEPELQPGTQPSPAWQSRLECVADKGGGRLYKVYSANQLERSLTEEAGRLQPSLKVSIYRSAGNEAVGDGSAGGAGWGVSVESRSGSGGEVRSVILPASFRLPPGNYRLRLWYQRQERVVSSLKIGPEERVEVQADFHSGELYIQAKGKDSEELVGETSDFGCFWGVEVYSEASLDKEVDATCAFPTHLVLRPGTYTVRVWKGEHDQWLEKVEVKEGETTVKSVLFPTETP